MGLAKAPQWCAVWLGAPPGVLCGTIQDLCRCLVPLMKKDDLLSVSMLEVTEEGTMTSPSPAEGTRSMDEESEPQEG